MQKFSRYCTGVLLLNSLLLIYLPFSAKAQKENSLANEEDTTVYVTYIPRFSWSAGIAYSSLLAPFNSGSAFPDKLEIQAWIRNRLYLQCNAYSFSDGELDNSDYFNRGFALSAGAALKLFLFRNTYFVPSLNLYFDDYPPGSDARWSLTIGPTIAFEYFFLRNRFSAEVTIVDLTWGISAKNDSTANQNSLSTRLTAHQYLGLGVRYNFDLKKSKAAE
ncbi:MAG: hypothetical protein ACHQD9_04740 [Chitinophagales bacterium]